MILGAIHIYPVKSGRALSLETAHLSREGLDHDRRWMLVDASGRFVSQRELPALAMLESEIAEDGLILTFADEGERFVPYPDGNERMTAHIWNDRVGVGLAGEETNIALSRWLKTDLRLVYQDRTDRVVDDAFAAPDCPVSLADGFPLLITTTASLRALNARLVHEGIDPVPMSRFRPNLVIDAAEAWQEDTWRVIRLGGVVLDFVKPCARCTITTIDQMDGRVVGEQPLAILRQTRLSVDRTIPGVLFGWNAVPRSEGRLDVGDTADVLERRDGQVVRG